MKILLFIPLAFLIGCALPGTPGYIKRTESMFDGAIEHKMESAWACRSVMSCRIRLGLYHKSSMPEDVLVMDVVVSGVESIDRGKSLHIRIDGEVISFVSMDALTEYETTPGIYQPGSVYVTSNSAVYMGGMSIPQQSWSSKRYIIKKALLKKMIEAQEVLIKVDLRKTYVEGVFSKDAPTLARPAFRLFYEKMQSF